MSDVCDAPTALMVNRPGWARPTSPIAPRPLEAKRTQWRPDWERMRSRLA